MRLLPTRRLCTASVRVADVTVKVSAAKTPHLVPHAFAAAGSPAPPQHLRWMAQKEALGQDVLLIGPPGGQKRQLALRWAEVAGREVESLALSSDTTEADLKQRRQVLDGNVYYVDAAPVRAAIAGRLLLLDGVEKAERNVLPTLNNLLENREMGLPDGRFLMSPARFDALLASGDHTHASLAARGYVRVHHDFRVIATGLPVPAFAGFPLDPPLRSRFQGLFCGVPPPALQLASVRALLSSSREAAPRGAAQSLVSWAEAVRAAARGSGGGQAEGRLLHLSDCSLRRAARVLASFPAHYDCGGGDALPPLLHRSFPHRLMGLEAPEAAGVAAAFEAAGMPPPSQLQGQRRPASVVEPDGAVVEGVIAGQGVTARVGLGCTRGVEVPVGALHGTASGGAVGGGEAWVETPALRACLLAMAEDHASGAHLCLVGAAGGGKSALAHRFGAAFGYRVRTAALAGDLCVLDGIHRLRPDGLASLHQLLLDGEATLHDGTRLLRAGHFDALRERLGLTAQQLADSCSVRRVHPSFRVVALAQPPSPTDRWLSSDLLPLFAWHELPPIGEGEMADWLAALCPALQPAAREALLCIADALDTSVPGGDALDSYSGAPPGGLSLSPRQLKRLLAVQHGVRRSLCAGLMSPALIADFEARVARALQPVVAALGIEEQCAAVAALDAAREVRVCELSGDGGKRSIAIGRARLPLPDSVSQPELVPDPAFHDNPTHLRLLEDLAADLVAGERAVLLIGNQGTGKNKLADRLLQLLRLERQYMQLHRDSTVQSLTVEAELVGGAVEWRDSPLVLALRHGHVLMLDEADKAPLEVVAVLKSLLADGQMLLSDGRRVLSPEAAAAEGSLLREEDVIIHDRFRVLTLANRPGFPFLGNDFFRECGTVFAAHVVDNPDAASQLELMAPFGTSVPPHVHRRIVGAFDELRCLVRDGLLAYPFSVREQVSVIKHLQAFPQDSVGQALGNVASFDAMDPPVDGRRDSAAPLACEVTSHELKARNVSYQFAPSDQRVRPLGSAVEAVEGRAGAAFSEEVRELQLLWGEEEGAPHCVACLARGGAIHVLASGPAALHSLPASVARERRAADGGESVSTLELASKTGSLDVMLAEGVEADEALLHPAGSGAIYRLRPPNRADDTHGAAIGAASFVELPESFHGGAVHPVPWTGALLRRQRGRRPHALLAAGADTAAGCLLAMRRGEASVLAVRLARWGEQGGAAAGTAYSIALPAELAQRGAVVAGGRVLGPCGEVGGPAGLLLQLRLMGSAEEGAASGAHSTAHLCALQLAGCIDATPRAWLFELDPASPLASDAEADCHIAAAVPLPGGEESAAIVCPRPGKDALLSVQQLPRVTFSSSGAPPTLALRGGWRWEDADARAAQQQAVRRAVEAAGRADADERIVVLLSDANLGRYDVSPEEIGEALRSNPHVRAYCVFVAEPAAAEWLAEQLPLGQGFAVQDVAKLPRVMKEVFAHAATAGP
ncbi:hypothetical protein EMIHUDRAFT_199335 [Emiliania huxleyi CCMP1516]|uniref:ATPase dynein-related AAA domain-containing protein n=2 Tax=Emiliania huxleyi TaxID=2903 RepID=A0A0D3KZE6_EMIH1|nr:hypothetical protein EMIHUDRAFT_199335 [Emiliania huxleyi CCMP1516]EOD41131.1 hypothetical protein EMIHUDRAFT_199335 [Emiliania huxleyi CCMP1516]|eukprot:XP_005793560.1 hypothetical protein EMIHUDRAFT_199335 [Emiliania huxleyi CCMP1516]